MGTACHLSPRGTLVLVVLCLPFAAAELTTVTLAPSNASTVAKGHINWKDRGEEFFKVEEDEPVGVGRFNDSLTHQEAVLETVRHKRIHDPIIRLQAPHRSSS